MDSVVEIECKVHVKIPRKEFWPYSGFLPTDKSLAKTFLENPSGSLLDFSQYDSVKITGAKINDTSYDDAQEDC